MSPPSLERVLGLPGATVVGLGSVLGTGLFVALALSVELAGAWAIAAVVLAGVVAACSGSSSARLAAAHPVSGGTYVYATRLLSPAAGFTAGWLFLAAKTASAATAALGVAAYALAPTGAGSPGVVVAAAVLVVLAVTGLVLAGMRRTGTVNLVLVTVTVGALLAAAAVMAAAAASDPAGTRERFAGLGTAPRPDLLLHASALAFVAFTGYGRVATLGEEVRDPVRTIPRAVVTTLLVSGSLAILVVATGIAAVGPVGFAGPGTAGTASGGGPADHAERVAVLERIVSGLAESGRLAPAIGMPVRWLLVAGAITAMVGVLLNLVLGLSRVLLAMGRDGCLPRRLGVLSSGGEPVAAIVVVGLAIAGLALVGDVAVAWTFSAVTVLAYYALTNLCAIRLPRGASEGRRLAPWAGLVGCLGLAAAIPGPAWLAAVGALAVGFLVRAATRRRSPR